MKFHRLAIIIVLFATLAGAIVYLKVSTVHSIYKLNKLTHQYEKQHQEYLRLRLELARKESPENLMEKLQSLKEYTPSTSPEIKSNH